MRAVKMGRMRKRLIDKTTPIIMRFDNRLLFRLCDQYDIPYDEDAEYLDNDTKKRINVEIKKIVSKNVK